jgi:hypothetical protein
MSRPFRCLFTNVGLFDGDGLVRFAPHRPGPGAGRPVQRPHERRNRTHGQRRRAQPPVTGGLPRARRTDLQADRSRHIGPRGPVRRLRQDQQRQGVGALSAGRIPDPQGHRRHRLPGTHAPRPVLAGLHSTWDAYATCEPIHNLTVLFGIHNLLDKNPPFTHVSQGNFAAE